MRINRISCALLLLLLAIAAVPLQGLRAEESQPASAAPSLPALLPATTVVYAEIPKPVALIETVLEHPLRKRAEKLPVVKTALLDSKVVSGLIALKFAEFQLGTTWQEAIARATENGLCVAIDGRTQGVAVITHGRDEATLKRLIDSLVKLARDDARGKNKPDPYETVDIAGVEFRAIGGSQFAVIGPHLVITNKVDLAADIVGRMKDKSQETLAAKATFVSARASVGDAPGLFAFVDLQPIRSAGLAPQLFSGKAENPGVELIIGGLLDILKQAPFVALRADMAAQSAGVRVILPSDSGWISETREYYFGSRGTGRAPQPIALEGQLFSLSAYRDIGTMWLRAGDLFDEQTNDRLSQIDGQLTTFFAGKDFGEDILGSFGPQVQVVAARQEFADDKPQPAIKLPEFAIVFEMKDPETSRREMRRTFQSFVGFVNVTGAMNGQPQLELDYEKAGDVELVTSSYIPEKGAEQSKAAKINFNFSPTVGFQGSRFVLASTTRLARRITAARTDTPTAAPISDNTRSTADLGVLKLILDDNKPQLIAQNMLEKGHTEEEARKEVSGLLEILTFFKSLDLRLTPAEKQTEFVFEVKFAE